MRGAEVALLADTRLKVGSSADCDIVINDASLAPFAFELEVSESAVTLITPDGTQTQMKPLEIRDFGTTAVAVGPADEPWGELVRPAPEAEEPSAPENAAEEAPQAAAADAEIQRLLAECYERAKEILLQGTSNLKSISDFCGFTNPNSLRKFFRRETGQTMSSWRAEHLNRRK